MKRDAELHCNWVRSRVSPPSRREREGGGGGERELGLNPRNVIGPIGFLGVDEIRLLGKN